MEMLRIGPGVPQPPRRWRRHLADLGWVLVDAAVNIGLGAAAFALTWIILTVIR